MSALSLALCVLPLALCAEGVYWNSAVTKGTWDDAANWTGGAVPGATSNVFITCKDGDYDVTIKSNATTYAWETTVGNANGTTTLRIDSPLELFDSTVASGNIHFYANKGAKVIVSKTGAINFVDVKSRYARGGFYINNADILVDGGVIDEHNTQGIYLTGTAAAPASLVVTNGGSVAWWCSGEGYGKFSLTDHTRVHIHDGAFAVNQVHKDYGWPYDLLGGEMIVSGTGVFTNMFSRDTAATGTFSYNLRGGMATFRDSAQFVQGCTDRGLYVAAKPNVTAEMVFAGRSCIGGGRLYEFIVGAGGLGSRSIFRWQSSSDSALGGVVSIIGYGRGQGELEISGGGTVSCNGYGLNVGRCTGGTCGAVFIVDAHDDFSKDYDPVKYPCSLKGASPSIHSPTGLVSVTKGNLYVHGTWRGSGHGNTRMSGFVIGDGAAVTGEVGRLVYGKVTVDGGTITNEAGSFLTGVGKATGILELKSGSVFKGQFLQTYGGVHQANAIGVGGGDGRWLISGGTATVEGHLFVGGVTTNDLDLFEMKDEDNAIKRYRDARGLISLSGTGKLQLKDGWNSYSVEPDGRIDTTKGDDRDRGYQMQGLWLGRDGEGTLELIGSQCSCIIARNLTVTNGWTFSETNRRTDGQGTLRFVFDEEGVGQVKVGTTLRLAPNAKLEVDMSAYRGQRKTPVKIIDCASRVGAFKAENVKLKGCELIQNDGDPDIYVKSTRRIGFCIFLK